MEGGVLSRCDAGIETFDLFRFFYTCETRQLCSRLLHGEAWRLLNAVLTSHAQITLIT